MSASDASADRSENTCSIVGAILWHINSQKGVFVFCCFYVAEPSDTFCLIAAVENLDVFHHLFAGVVSLIVIGDSVYDLCYSFY